MNRHPVNGIISWLIGPIGAGKSTIAIQWAQELGLPVQYVSSRPPRLQASRVSHPPDEFGKSLEDLLNACSDATIDPTPEQISPLVNRALALSQSEPCLFVLDDLELVRRRAMNVLQQLLIENLPQFRAGRGVMISRTVDSSVLGSLQRLQTLRVVLPHTLGFSREETEEAQRIGVFGSATLQEAEAARSESDGWITGMLISLEGKGGLASNPIQFRNDVMNDLLLYQPAEILQIMMASACVPIHHMEIWERWFDHFRLPPALIPSTISQLPTTNDPETRDRFSIAPAMRTALQDLRNITVQEEPIHDLLKIALDWYIEEGLISAAASVAAECDLRDYLLHALRAVCTRHAEKEDWSAIVEVLSLVPEQQLVQDPGLTFWYFLGLVENDLWGRMRRLYDQVAESWSESTDPLVLGRSHLVRAWNAHMLVQGDKTLMHAESAYTTLPANVHRERLWAAGTASLAQSISGNREEARRWSALANFEHTFLASPSRWWHNNAGPLRLSWIAIGGLLDEAYDEAAREVRDLGGKHADLSARYLILMAQIDTERHAFDSASELIEKTTGLDLTSFSLDHHLRIAQANLLRARGEYQAALEFLSTAQRPPGQRFDQFARERFALANLALETGDIEASEFYLSGGPTGDAAWPKNFGDAHAGLTGARLHFALGRQDDAISLAHSVATEAASRNHAQYDVSANATLAFMYHQLGMTTQRDEAILAARNADRQTEFHQSFIVAGQDIRDLATSHGNQNLPGEPGTSSTIRASSVRPLTARELEVVSLVAQGQSNKQIASRMFISVSTVKNHLASAYDKLGAKNRREAARFVRELGLVES